MLCSNTMRVFSEQDGELTSQFDMANLTVIFDRIAAYVYSNVYMHLSSYKHQHSKGPQQIFSVT